ncbi:MAG TPA: hypothetical protein VGO55_15955 [Allosphingosinicella sp.]|nr:hypothetical protein [Allosphingosinicella sp.]
MATVYDQGHTPIAFVMATEVQKILTENSAATRLRGSRQFSTPARGDNPQNLMAFHKLTLVSMSGMPPTLEFKPKFYDSDAEPPLLVEFKDWWNKDIIYRASAAPPGTLAGMIPVNGSPEVPYDEREKTTRMRLVSLLRNKLGSHQTSEMPKLLDELDEARNWANFAVQTPDGLYTTDDGSLRVSVSPIPAMMRQICHELLIAYGRPDSAPVRDEQDGSPPHG